MPRGVKVQVLPGAPSQEKGRSSSLLRPFFAPALRVHHASCTRRHAWGRYVGMAYAVVMVALAWLANAGLQFHRADKGACPRRTGPEGCNATPLWHSGHSPVWEWRSSGQNMFCKPRLRPPCPDSVRPAPRAHSGTRPVTDAKKTRSAQTGFLLYAVTGLRSSTHSNGAGRRCRADGTGVLVSRKR